MIEGRSVLAIIPARGGSKGLRHKNIRDLGGKPLIAWTLEAAKESRFIDRVIVSSDDREIHAAARQFGGEVPFDRPAHLASDTARTIDVVKHAISSLDKRYDYVIQLQPTSPLRTSADIDGALELCVLEKALSCVSVCRAKKSISLMCMMQDHHRLSFPIGLPQGVSRRQELAVTFEINGAIYAAQTVSLERSDGFICDTTVGFEMPRERSYDIDSQEDLEFIETLLGAVSARGDAIRASR